MLHPTNARMRVIRWPRARLHNLLFPYIIQLVGWHRVAPFQNGWPKTDFTEDPVPINHLAVKLSGDW